MTVDGGRVGPPEIWAGVECTVNRVGDRYFDQLERGGHSWRESDLDLLAWLGVRAVRYPVLWERTAPEDGPPADWSWPDRRLGRLRALGIKPIVGLLHHGSGPPHTNLTDPRFAEKLARYAAQVADRYPWVEDWTPVNEVTTTARFSGLYGLWFPHGRDIATFARAVVNQCRAVAMSMTAIRRTVPGARLIHTEDVGRIQGTAVLADQVGYENQRRLLGLDLLMGRVTSQHPLHGHLLDCGVEEAELAWFLENSCPPDLIGINYYLTSDRYLDHRIDRYPPHTRGGNGRQAYADVEAVRVAEVGISGHLRLLSEVWRRYHRPLAITEVHAGCTREEQLRWLREAWTAACSARRQGIDLRAVTVWSLLGSFSWDRLLVCDDGGYEPGVFDLRGRRPRPTAIARAVRTLAIDHVLPEHPAAAGPGWWRRPGRVLYSGTVAPQEDAQCPASPLLITGAAGTLGMAFARMASTRGLAFRVLARGDMDIAEPLSVAQRLDEHRPWAVINAAGYVRVDDAEGQRDRCWRENALGPQVLAAACAERGIRLLTFSSDLVFDGASGRPYRESHVPAPLGVYGWSKLEAERGVLAAMPEALVIRTAAFFGPWDPHNFVTQAMGALRAGRPFRAASDLVVSPTYVPDLVNAALDLLIDGERGIWHLANIGATSWADLARRVAQLEGLDQALVEPCPAHLLGLVAARPPFSALESERGALLRPLDAALEALVRQPIAA